MTHGEKVAEPCDLTSTNEIQIGPNELLYCNKDGVVPIHTIPKGPCTFPQLFTSLA